MFMSTPVLNGNRLHGMSDKQRGSLFTIDVATGAVKWKSDGRLGANASVTDVGAALFVVTEGGGCRCGKGGDELKGLAKYKVADSPVWASPAVVGDQVLIKDKTNLTLFQFKG